MVVGVHGYRTVATQAYLNAMLMFKLPFLVVVVIVMVCTKRDYVIIFFLNWVINWHPFLRFSVEFELGAVVAHGDELVIELRERNSIVAIEIVDWERRFHDDSQLEQSADMGDVYLCAYTCVYYERSKENAVVAHTQIRRLTFSSATCLPVCAKWGAALYNLTRHILRLA